MYAAHVDAADEEGFHGLDHEDKDIRVFQVLADEAISWLHTNKITNANLLIALQAFALRRDGFISRWPVPG